MKHSTRLATATAALVILAQVASKSVRDGLFLGVYGEQWLPTAVIAGAVLSWIVVLLTTRLLIARDVGTVAVALFSASAALFAIEWWLAAWSPAAAAAVVYGHVTGLGAVLVSVFWNLVNSASDPRTARKSLGTIGVGATFGGLVGGLMAERVVAVFDVRSLLLVLAVIAIGCAALSRALVRGTPAAATSKKTRVEPKGALGLLAKPGPLRQLVLLVIIVSATGGLLDFLMKQAAVATLESEEELTRFFGLLYTAVAFCAFAFQATLGRRALEWFGLAKTAAVLPVFLVVGGAACIVFHWIVDPCFGPRRRGRVQQLVLSVGAYELFFAPIAAKEREASKLVVDVGSHRVGDAAAGFTVQGLLVLAGGMASRPFIAGAATGLAVAGVVVVRRIARAYVTDMQRRLLAGRRRRRTASVRGEARSLPRDDRCRWPSTLEKPYGRSSERKAPRSRLRPPRWTG